MEIQAYDVTASVDREGRVVERAANVPGVSVQSDSHDESPVRLVGREREIGLLRDELQRVLDGHGRLVLVFGEAGIGKTSLVSVLAHQAEAQGCLVLWGHAYDLSVTPPYGPWLDMLSEYPHDVDGLPRPSFAPAASSQAAAGSQDALFADIASFFQETAVRRPLVLVIDDLHWSDQGSLDFLRFLARQIGAHRILLIATYRSDELHRHHPLYDLLPLLIRESVAERVEVRRRDAEGHRSLIASRYVMSEEDAARLEQHLHSHAEGNPFFALELLRNLEEEGALRQVSGVWSLGDTSRFRIPPLIRQVIERRLARLGDQERSLL
ncbi:MAG TPA: ATP-binding protein, partial [Thermomicrobiales bacterium]|nr:ATP-binding protein [Thermomicrobiales bacterium]